LPRPRIGTRELLFSSVVDLMALVVCGVRKGVHAAYQASAGDIAVSLTSVYNMLNGIEPGLSAALVRHPALRGKPPVSWIPNNRNGCPYP
jgi:hypothetical protein